MGLTDGVTARVYGWRVELTAEQQQVVNHGDGMLRVAGRAGSGKTTALVQRYLRLARETPPSRVLVLCRRAEAATRFRDTVLPALAGGFDALPITSFRGLAFDVVGRGGEQVRVLSPAEQRRLVGDLLAGDSADDWPALQNWLGRAAFVDEVTAAVLHWQGAARVGLDGERWQELAAFAARYRAALEREGALDGVGLLVRAARLLDAHPPSYTHVLVDDFEAATAPVDAMLQRVTATAATVCVTGNVDAAVGARHGASSSFFEQLAAPTVVLDESFRRPAPPELARCEHPALEAEAVAAELVAAHDAGVPWSEMAVLVRRRRPRARGINRALARHGIPAALPESELGDEPVVTAVVELLLWAAGDDDAQEGLTLPRLAGLDAADVGALRAELRSRLDEGADPAALAFLVWERALAPLLVNSPDPADDRALDAFTAFYDALSRQVERNPDLPLAAVAAAVEGDGWRGRRAQIDAVSVLSIEEAAGREWHTVVLAGAVEGELPAIRAHQPVFDPVLLEGGTPPSPAERRRASLAEERRLFTEVALTRARSSVVATAAPEPGVLLSRFVEGWPARPPRALMVPGPPPVVRAATVNAGPAFPDRSLTLSASQLETYDDCPLRYFYEYVLRVRSEAGVYAELGSLVHEVMADFLDPDAAEPADYSLEGLRAVAEAHWRDDIARYRPQVEEARRSLFEMLERWWEEEGELGRPDVLAVERRFEVDVGPHRVVGSIDRVDRHDGGLRIVDYKTSTKETAEQDMPDNVQLAVYHLAACRDEELAACGPADELDLVFLRSMKVRRQPVTDDHEAATEARVLAVADRILAEEFEPSVDANCRICAFTRLCPIQPQGRETEPDV